MKYIIETKSGSRYELENCYLDESHDLMGAKSSVAVFKYFDDDEVVAVFRGYNFWMKINDGE